jgi:hypothetical protein
LSNRAAWRARYHRMTSFGESLPEGLQWGHPLLTPEGREIRVPAPAFRRLRRLGVLMRNSAQLSERIYELLDPQYDSITEGLRLLLGPDLSGPAWCRCDCKECRERASEADRTPLPGRAWSSLLAELALEESRRRRSAAHPDCDGVAQGQKRKSREAMEGGPVG